ncbi:hypothetical protein [Ferruginibacter sp. HRS2-29]|uniref:hypothetical protein n=1 Tax=Ferruginibacter sp. HRS2-29 TaxID=2487334 RepID=UPI0020CD625C|nr:hypothetical protein [Ferruginibacter sp. HRS2-29]MCP9752392.1 hypothetical protein [Ferruginibacter sp. HRS2-29]
MENKKTDESVKTGLEVEAVKVEDINTEKDPDELVHEKEDELPDTVSTEQDMDDLVHTHATDAPVNELEEKDIDDLMHQAPNDNIEEDQR